MGRTYSEERFSEQRNYTSFSMKPIFVGAYCVLSALSAYALTGPVTDKQAVNRTLKMCNEKPLECKFKYDIIRYNETGQVPYKEEKPVEKKTK
jgi:hypothetical protein